MKKNETWLKFRHKVITALLRPVLGAYTRLRYHVKIDRLPGDRAYLILLNHQTGWDQFFVGITFDRPVYYVASEDIFSMGWVSDLIRYLVEPIPIKKQTLDLNAVKTCIKVAREGGSICIAPEGNRTYHGKSLYMKPGIASLAKKLGLPIALMRIEGGYGIQPRWSDVIRRGRMRTYVSRVIEPEEYAAMTGDELYEAIQKELWVDEAQVTGQYRHKRNAEFLERLVYTCPRCGLAPFESHNDLITCGKCGLQVRHLPTKELEGVDAPFPYRFVAEWYDAQNALVGGLDLDAYREAPAFTDRARFSLVHVYRHKETVLKDARICLYGDRITVDERVYSFDALAAVTVLGKNKLNLYTGTEVFQLKGDKRFNAIKYVNFFHRYKNVKAGNENGNFLGL